MAYNYELVIKDLESFYSGEGKDSFKEELLNKIKSLPKMGNHLSNKINHKFSYCMPWVINFIFKEF